MGFFFFFFLFIIIIFNAGWEFGWDEVTGDGKKKRGVRDMAEG
jgi:hypothetical protein